MSERTAGLLLDGAYAGIIDGFERFVNTEDGARIVAQAVPSGEFLPLNFLIDDAFFADPPEFADVYLIDDGAVIYLNGYPPREQRLRVIAQTDFAGGRYTLFENGGKVYLNVEREKCRLWELPAEFREGALVEERVCGYPVLVVSGNGCLSVFSEEGERVFINPAESWSAGDRLKVTVNFATCAGHKAECSYVYDGRKMTLESSLTREYALTNGEILHFAFFESVLTHGDFAKYLSEELQESADGIYAFLGEFTEVVIPNRAYLEKHGNLRCAGLVYPVKKRLYKVRYFAVDVEDGKISNIFEVE